MFKRSLATAAVLAGLLAASAPAYAGPSVGHRVAVESLEAWNLPEVEDEVLV